MAKDDFYIVNSWMIETLGLSGIELQCFAIIWSLSRGDKQMYIAGNSYLVRMTKKTEHTIITTLKSLCNKGLIIKYPVVVDKVERNYYKAIRQGEEPNVGYCKNFSGGTEKISVGGTEKISAPYIESNYIERNKNEKCLSNDKQKIEYSEEFNKLWTKYKEGTKSAAYKAWNKLTAKERQAALDKVDDYLTYCRRKGREKKDTSSYLNQKCFNEDTWTKIPECYELKDGENERIAGFKSWMCKEFADLIYHRKPLTFEQMNECIDKYTFNQTEWAMRQLCKRDIHQYYSIVQGIDKVIMEELPEFAEQ